MADAFAAMSFQGDGADGRHDDGRPVRKSRSPARATTEELRLAIEPLATRQELKALEVTLRREIREEGDRSRRHMEIVTEAQRDDIRVLAEHLSAVLSKLEDR
jgi:hypothetical protein